MNTPTPETNAQMNHITESQARDIAILILANSKSPDPDVRERTISEIAQMLMDREILEQQLLESQQYADKLADGLPEGMLPADIDNLREANAAFADENMKLKEELLESDTTNELLCLKLNEALDELTTLKKENP